MPYTILGLLVLLTFGAWSQTETIEEIRDERDSLKIVALELNETPGYLTERVELLQVTHESDENSIQQYLAQLKKENEALREIMKGYIRKIDELNTFNLNIQRDKDILEDQLVKCNEAN